MPNPRTLDQSVSRDISYDPETGDFIWISTRNGRVKVGQIAGHIDAVTGYRFIGWMNKVYPAHRVAWFLTHGEMPHNEVDHIDGDRANNRLSNLRLASSSENRVNTKIRSNNKSGFKGVYWHKASNAWRAQIRTKGKTFHLGKFDDPEEAHAAYVTAAKRLHGEYANDGNGTIR